MNARIATALSVISGFTWALTSCAGDASQGGGQAGSESPATGGALAGTSGSSGSASGGVSGTGAVSGNGTGGVATGGSLATGGQSGSATLGGTGGSVGGQPNGGTSPGGSSAGGAVGGMSAGAGAGGTGVGGAMSGAGGAASGAGGKGAGGKGAGGGGNCQKGQVAGNQVLLIGDSFIALNRSITNELQRIARAAGALEQNETYQDRSVSGTTLANNQIPGQFTGASGTIKVVLMDGGGNDCLLNNAGDPAVTAATSLFQTMGQRGTESVVYFFYPDPQGSLGMGTLKTCLDGIRPRMKTLCESLSSPKCYFIDLRPVFEGHYAEYILSDGIHPTTAGGSAVAQAVWQVMQQNCIAQ